MKQDRFTRCRSSQTLCIIFITNFLDKNSLLDLIYLLFNLVFCLEKKLLTELEKIGLSRTTQEFEALVKRNREE